MKYSIYESWKKDRLFHRCALFRGIVKIHEHVAMVAVPLLHILGKLELSDHQLTADRADAFMPFS